ncbi:MAG: DUF177 domain-containing protein [Nitrospirota bacterium]
MKIVIAEIPEEGLDLEFEETITTDAFSSPIQARLRVKKVATEVAIKGNLTANIELQCSRCLKNFISPLSVPVDVVYHPVEELREEERHELKAEELDMGFYSGEEMNLYDLIREQIMLNLPMKPLCSEQCKGICPKCGVDLNLGECGCSKKDIDPRLEALKKLLE